MKPEAEASGYLGVGVRLRLGRSGVAIVALGGTRRHRFLGGAWWGLLVLRSGRLPGGLVRGGRGRGLDWLLGIRGGRLAWCRRILRGRVVGGLVRLMRNRLGFGPWR